MRVEEELLQKRMKKIKAGEKLAKRAGLKNKKENNDEKILVEIGMYVASICESLSFV